MCCQLYTFHVIKRKSTRQATARSILLAPGSVWYRFIPVLTDLVDTQARLSDTHFLTFIKAEDRTVSSPLRFENAPGGPINYQTRSMCMCDLYTSNNSVIGINSRQLPIWKRSYKEGDLGYSLSWLKVIIKITF